MISVAVLNMNPVTASAIFMLIAAIATCIIIYTVMVYKKEKKQKNTLLKQIEEVLSLITLIIYFAISFTTMAWHLTWIIWIIFGLVMEIIKLIFMLKGDNNEE